MTRWLVVVAFATVAVAWSPGARACENKRPKAVAAGVVSSGSDDSGGYECFDEGTPQHADYKWSRVCTIECPWTITANAHYDPNCALKVQNDDTCCSGPTPIPAMWHTYLVDGEIEEGEPCTAGPGQQFSNCGTHEDLPVVIDGGIKRKCDSTYAGDCGSASSGQLVDETIPTQAEVIQDQ